MFKLLLGVVLVSLVHGQLVPLQVNTTQGLVEGYKSLEGNYFEFYGIRYGAPTFGLQRFKAPSPAPPYGMTFSAVERNVQCAQPGSVLSTGEDCLRLNIFTKNETYAKPVFVWLEGEDYLSSHMTPTFSHLTDRDLLVVTLNYRVSIFGFLCLGVPEAPGNAGLKDIILGLRWIKENIIGFGGDPNNVILLGHGSGAAMVDLITLSPLSEGLVHKAIALSGSALAPWSVAYDPIGYAEDIGRRLSFNGMTRSRLANALANVEDMNLLMSVLEFDGTNNTVLFAPCVENTDLEGSFLTDPPLSRLQSGNYSHIPYLAGYTDREGTIRVSQSSRWLPMMNTNFSRFIQVDLEFGTDANKTNTVGAIRDFYFTNANIDIEGYLDYHGDTSVLVSVVRGAAERAATSRATVHLFEFAYRGATNAEWAYPEVPLNGVRHGGILNYLFNINLTPQGANAMTSLLARFVNFARTGTPNGASPRAGSQWLPATREQLNYLHFGGPATQDVVEEPKFNPHTQRMDLWNGIFTKYYKSPPRVTSSSYVCLPNIIVLLSTLFVRFNYF